MDLTLIATNLSAEQKAIAYDSCNRMENQGTFAYNLSKAFIKGNEEQKAKLFYAFEESFTQGADYTSKW